MTGLEGRCSGLYLDAALRLLREAGLAPRERSAVAEAWTWPEAGGTQLRFRAFALRGGEVRFTGIDSRAACIFSMMIFPARADLVPVFASEFVVLGRLVRAAVVDLQGLAEGAVARAKEVLPSLAARHAPLMAEGPLPEWCREHFTREAVFVLREGQARLPELDAALWDYLRAFAPMLAGAPTGVAGAAAVQAYMHHHITHTPGRRYLSRLGGEAWCERFLREGMYAPLRLVRRAASTRYRGVADMASLPTTRSVSHRPLSKRKQRC